MSEFLETCAVSCPYCGEPLELLVDVSAGGQTYVEDCAVCCRPIECLLSVQGEDWRLEVRRDDE